MGLDDSLNRTLVPSCHTCDRDKYRGLAWSVNGQKIGCVPVFGEM